MTPAHHRQRWHSASDARLRHYLDLGMSSWEISQAMGRTQASIQARARVVHADTPSLRLQLPMS